MRGQSPTACVRAEAYLLKCGFVSRRFSGMGVGGVSRKGCLVEAVATIVVADHPCDVLDSPRTTAAGDVDDDVHRLGDERARGSHGDLKDELFEPEQRSFGRSRMDRRNATGMPSAPRLEQVERFPAADFTDDHAI